MQHIILVFFILIVLLLILWGSVALGRRFGLKQIQKNGKHKLEVVGVAESAVFGLLGLLIAFTFSGAYERYENRKFHILEEANVFDTAYEMIDFVAPKYQPDLRRDVRQYLDLHLATYHDIPNMTAVGADMYKAIAVQHRIWHTIILANNDDPNHAILQLVAPAMSKMFEAFHSGINVSLIHPPPVIFLLLIGLAALGGFLVGYNVAESAERNPVHVLCYVLLTAFIMYLILNLEYPRVGFVKLTTFDQMLVDVRQDMNYTN